MRSHSQNNDVSVHAIAGTEVVLLGLNIREPAAEGLLGFAILRRGPLEEQYLSDGRDFQGPAKRIPILQTFLWGDYVVQPNTGYTYHVTPMYGDPADPRAGAPVEVSVTTEDPVGTTHGIYFNRGVAGSHAYSHQFGDHRRWYKEDPHEENPAKMKFKQFLKPQDVPERAAYQWLSRGLEEALLGFIGQAAGPGYALRVAAYELTHFPVIRALVDALERGVDVKVVHHAKRETVFRLIQNPQAVTTVQYSAGEPASRDYKHREVAPVESGDSVCLAAHEAVAQVGVADAANLARFREMFIPRTITQISHNKFIVLLKDNQPVEVWTGSTNFTPGGIFGQSNVGHIVREPDVAQKYFEYWKKLSTDPKKHSDKADPPDTGMQNWTVLQQPDLQGPPRPNSVTPVFSPRLTKNMLDWYAEQMTTAKQAVFFTAAFSVADEIFEHVKSPKAPGSGGPFLRFLLLEGRSGLLKDKFPVMAKCLQNRIAWGELLQGSAHQDTHEEIETLTGLNENVNYLHTKYLLIDPLSNDPLVITGSANFSKPSTVDNDENMLIIRGDQRVADIYLGEFMRLFNHFRRRNQANRLSQEERAKAIHLCPDASWAAPYFVKGSPEEAERVLFSQNSRSTP